MAVIVIAFRVGRTERGALILTFNLETARCELSAIALTPLSGVSRS